MDTLFALGLMPVEFYLFIALIVAGLLACAGWLNECERRSRLKKAALELEKIQALSAEALTEDSPQKVEQVNTMIGAWDENYTEEIGEPVAKLKSYPAR